MYLRFVTISTLLLVLITLSGFSQDQKEYNTIDEKGQKQGYWEKKYDNGNTKYAGFFKNNAPIGNFKRFDLDGNLIAEMEYKEESNRVFTKLFYKGNKLQAEGYFINQLKDSIWRFYSIEGFCINQVPFVNNQKHGSETKFHDNGNVYEKVEWKNGKKNGLTIRYYDNGNVMNRISFKNDILHGEYNVYGPENNISIQGQYENNKRIGKWIYYKNNGHIEGEIEYIDGIAKNQDKLKELETKRWEELENNKDKFQEPMDQMYNSIPPR